MRCFFALDIPFSVKKEIGAIQKDVIETVKNIQMIKPDNIHITLKFIGNIDESTLRRIGNVILSKRENYGKIPIVLSGIGVFPNVKNARVLWIGINRNDSIMRLHKVIDTALEKMGFMPEREFVPHVTIGRMKADCDEDALNGILNKYKDYKSKQFEIDTLILKESTLTPLGAVYCNRQTFPLVLG